MNSLTYADRIAKEFGGLKVEELKTKLLRLVTLAKNEKSGYKNKVQKKTEIPLSTTFKQVNKNVNKPMSNRYDKVMGIINSSRTLKTWLSIEVIPIDLFAEFRAIISVRKDVIFDPKRNYTYFRALTDEELEDSK